MSGTASFAEWAKKAAGSSNNGSSIVVFTPQLPHHMRNQVKKHAIKERSDDWQVFVKT